MSEQQASETSGQVSINNIEKKFPGNESPQVQAAQITARSAIIAALITGILGLATGLLVTLPGIKKAGPENTIPQASPLPTLSNVSRTISFEEGLGELTTLGVCDRYPDPWQSNCADAPARLTWTDNSYSGGRSLGIKIELLPDREQVYSLRLPQKSAVLADGVSASLFIPQSNSPLIQALWINLICKLAGTDYWVYSSFPAEKNHGWVLLFLDLREYIYEDKTAADIGIEDVHIDVFLPKTSSQIEEFEIDVDNVQIFTKLSVPGNTR
jgi:hypothetical protein